MDWEGASEAAARAIAIARPTAKATTTITQDKQTQKNPTDLSNPTTSQVLSKKNKPIPPPLDLSIGAANLSLHHHHHQHHPNNNTTTTNSNTNPNHHLQQQPPNQIYQHYQHQQPYLGSPKFTQSDKNLPLRKRWHSWSPILMNGQEESMVPLYSDTHMSSNKTGGGGDTPHSHSPHIQPQPYPPQYSSPDPGSNYGRPGHYGNGTGTPPINMNNNLGNHVPVHVSTPTPFYTPNEPSPKFMNSPVFSYSNPDTSLYQGPFSPMRASTLYPPPNSPFTNLNLNSPLGPLQTSTGSSGINSGGGIGNPCFNMIPSTLLSPAPSQASTNSLSYEDLHEKSLSFFTAAWSIFMAGTKVRFVTGMNSMDWYMVDFLAQSGDSLGLKGEYAPHGLEVRKFVVTSSAKERIQVTFCPVADPHHPAIEVNCEPGHPFMVDKKGWCAVKPDVFHETYGTPCQTLECGDVCMSLTSARSPNQYLHQQHNSQVFPVTVTTTHSSSSNNNGNNSPAITRIKEEKLLPVSVVPQTQMQMHSPMVKRELNSIPISAPSSPAKRPAKDASQAQGEAKGRRPMNAFLLFAKDKRPELIQMYPGKDNRSISVLLGEAWQSLAPPEKEKYASSARARAEEQKRMHPDCWKRKRSQSTSS